MYNMYMYIIHIIYLKHYIWEYALENIKLKYNLKKPEKKTKNNIYL